MNFADLDFWKAFSVGFFIIGLTLCIVRAVRGHWGSRLGKLGVLVLSLSLLASESWETLAVFLWVTVVGYIGLYLLQTYSLGKHRVFGIVIIIVAQIAPLFYYKYSDFVIADVLGMDWSRHGVLIPMGISFYTFQMIGITIDSLKNKKRVPKGLDFINFASFFPQIVAGPIERREDLLPQVKELKYRIVTSRVASASSWLVLGFFYKLAIADNFGLAIDGMRVDSVNGFHVWSECIFFGFRIYFDFAGYSFIAFGLAAIFGIDLKLNFLSPYLAINIQDFWRRWHVTLSSWFRDYVYIPLGGSRSKRVVINVMIVFLVSGIWHGAGWNFILWGLLHGAGVAILTKVKFRGVPKFVSWAVTMAYVFFAWLFFYETSSQELWRKVGAITLPSGYSAEFLQDYMQMFTSRGELLNCAFLLLLSFVAIGMEAMSIKCDKPYKYLRAFGVSVILVILTVLLAPAQKADFIYFNF